MKGADNVWFAGYAGGEPVEIRCASGDLRLKQVRHLINVLRLFESWAEEDIKKELELPPDPVVQP
jgi:hypothetical protein